MFVYFEQTVSFTDLTHSISSLYQPNFSGEVCFHICSIIWLSFNYLLFLFAFFRIHLFGAVVSDKSMFKVKFMKQIYDESTLCGYAFVAFCDCNETFNAFVVGRVMVKDRGV